MSYPTPLWWDIIILTVTSFSALVNSGALAELKPVKTEGPESSGRREVIGVSRERSPRSMSCRREMEVRSLVQEATHMTVSREIGLDARGEVGSSDCVPTDLV